MAEETKVEVAPTTTTTTEAAAAAPPAAEEVVVVEKPVTEKELPPAPEPEPEAPEKKQPAAEEEPVAAAAAAEEAAIEAAIEEEKPTKEEAKIAQSSSFKEETNVVGELPENQKKALDELKQLIQDALNKHEFTAPPAPPAAEEKKKEEEKPAEEAAAEKKEEEKVEEEKKEEEKVEEKKEEEVAAAASTSEEPKTEEKVEVEVVKDEEGEKKEEVKEEEKKVEEAAPAAEVAVVEEEKVAAVDEDGAKTVEAIKETIVAVSSATPPAEEAAAADTSAKEAAPAEEAKEETKVETEPAAPPPPPEEVFIWGIPLLGDEKSDVILLKFLRARDFKVKDAFAMIKNTVKWRKEFGIDSLLDEDLGNELEKAVYMHGADKEGHPVCYNVFGAFQDKELYQNCFADDEKRKKFLRWRIQFLEKSIRKLDFSPTGISTIVQVNDLKNSPVFAVALRQATNQALALLQDNYPEFVAKQVFINVPWWYLAFNRMISPFLTQRTKSKFVFAGPSKSAETLFKYIAPELVPVQYGGLSREGEQEFSAADSVIEVTIKPTSKHQIEFPVSESGTLVWELRVVGWEVSYGAEFVPSADDGYTVIVSKARKVTATDEPVITDTFKVGEPGKIVLTLDNQTSKKKKLLYRSKTKPVSE
ncbi:hypothetical protein Tsubulata_049208 [Turnera subulata]|uniref:CRAL-TRIO domain-containing protein n=1 Tax=Turnera subulata TaxID=218843 RepID=A0A9Q0FPT8_9ROSI|nr:hypothetical protein Tsubulata_049208 [Turnera subulata]